MCQGIRQTTEHYCGSVRGQNWSWERKELPFPLGFSQRKWQLPGSCGTGLAEGTVQQQLLEQGLMVLKALRGKGNGAKGLRDMAS